MSRSSMAIADGCIKEAAALPTAAAQHTQQQQQRLSHGSSAAQ